MSAIDIQVNEICELKERLRRCTGTDEPDFQQAVNLLKVLQQKPINAHILHQTKIGHFMKKLKKHRHEEVRELASQIYRQWKRSHSQAAPSSKNSNQAPPPSKSQTPKSESESQSSSGSQSNSPESTTPGSRSGEAEGTDYDFKRQRPLPIDTSNIPDVMDYGRATTPLQREKILNRSTGNHIRDSVRTKLGKVLYAAAPERDSEDCDELGIAIETAIFDLFPFSDGRRQTKKDYSVKARDLLQNIRDKRNPDLKRLIFKNEILPPQLVRMSNRDLASDALKQERAESDKYHLDESRSDLKHKQQSTDMFKCGKCKKRSCTYYQMQTRSADEPMTTFVTCTVCGNRWRC